MCVTVAVHRDLYYSRNLAGILSLRWLEKGLAVNSSFHWARIRDRQAWRSLSRSPQSHTVGCEENGFARSAATKKMAKRSNPAFSKPVIRNEPRGCVISQDESAAHSIKCREQCSTRGRIHLRGPNCQLHFSLAARRRTIHSVWATSRSE